MIDFDIVLKNALIIQKGTFFRKNVGLKEGKIAKISDSPLPSMNVLDCRGKFLIPGLIDSQVHFRFPGLTHKEDWASGSRAALAGGVTTVIDMPNTIPPLTSRELLDEKTIAVKKESLCNFLFHFAATNENLAELKRLENASSIAVFMGNASGSLLIKDEKTLEEVFKAAEKRDLPVVVHAEDEDLIKEHSERILSQEKNSVQAHNLVRTETAEKNAIEKALALQRKANNRIHFANVSTENGLHLIAEAKKQGFRGISCSVNPNHLFLSEEELEELGNFGKINPPLRSKSDQLALWKGIQNGSVDCIASYHSPHTIEEKKTGYWSAPAGIPGIETMLPLLLNSVASEQISLPKVVELCCENPARIFGLRGKGQVKEGFDADLVLVDLQGKTEINNKNLKTKCGWSPFDRLALKGSIEKVFIAGKEFKGQLEL